jgi:hypothetical protein
MYREAPDLVEMGENISYVKTLVRFVVDSDVKSLQRRIRVKWYKAVRIVEVV